MSGIVGVGVGAATATPPLSVPIALMRRVSSPSSQVWSLAQSIGIDTNTGRNLDGPKENRKAFNSELSVTLLPSIQGLNFSDIYPTTQISPLGIL